MTISDTFAFDSDYVVLVTITRSEDNVTHDTCIPCRSYDAALRTEKAIHDGQDATNRCLTRIYELKRP